MANPNDKRIYKNSLKERSSTSVVVGGADTSDLPSKQAIIDEKIAEAMEKTRIECQKIKEDAHEEAEEIIAMANGKASSIEKEAFAKGYEDGRQEGIKKINEELKTTLNDAQVVLEQIEKERKECLEDEENRVLGIISKISKKLLKRDLSLNNEMTLEFIKSGINSLSHRATVNIYVNPETSAKLNEIRESILEENPGIESLNISASKHLDFGDMILESNRERLDLRLDSQLEELLATITEKDN